VTKVVRRTGGARRPLPRAVILFGLVSLLNDLSSEMIYPLLPALVTGVLGAGAAALGALDGGAEFAAAVVKFAAGKLADRTERRGRLVVLGYAVAVAVRPIIAAAAAAWQVIGLRVVDRLGKGLRTPPRDALIADLTPASERGRAFGVQRGLDHAGAVLGPVLAWYLLAHHTSVRHVIAASLIPGLVVLVLAVWAVRAAGTPEAARNAATPRQRPVAPPVVFGITAFYLLRLPETLIILRAQQLGVAVVVVPLLWAAVHVVKSATSFAGGHASDRWGPERTMWGGWVCYAGLAAAMGAAHSTAAAWALFLALGVVAGLTEGPERALVARLAGARHGSGFGSYHAVTGLAALTGGLGLGLLYEQRGAAIAFFVSAAGGLAVALVALFSTVRGGRATA